MLQRRILVMSEPKDTPRYDVDTNERGGLSYHLGEASTHETTIRDNSTGKEYSAYGTSEKDSRDSAWEKVNRDN